MIATTKKAARTVKTTAAPRKNKVIAATMFALALAVLSVSLPHLASGFVATLGASTFAAGALAVLFDLSQIAAEVFLISNDTATTGERWTAKSVVAASTAVSIAYNGLAFLKGADGSLFSIVAAYVLAALLPVGVLALSYLGSRALTK